MDIQTNVDILMQADFKDWHYYEMQQKKMELISLLKEREKENDQDVPLISLRGYALTHEDVTRMAEEVEDELNKTRKELGYKE